MHKRESSVLKGHTVLVVDDESDVRGIVEALLFELEVTVVHAESVVEARSRFSNFHIDLVLSDIAMPGGETGIDLLNWCRKEHIPVPFILLSGYVKSGDVRSALSLGVQHVIRKPFNRNQLLDAVVSCFAVSDSYSNLLSGYIREIELNHQLLMATIDGFAAAIGARDGYTLQHSEQVSELAVLLSRKIGLDKKNVQTAGIAGKLHDIGKIGVPESILLKKGILTPDEFDVMKSHPVKAAEILGSIPSLSAEVDGAKYHHEWFDGTGYPEGLKGDSIPLMGRILAICDAYSAMITQRPYRPAVAPGEAREEIRLCSSTQFDPILVSEFLFIPEIAEA